MNTPKVGDKVYLAANPERIGVVTTHALDNTKCRVEWDSIHSSWVNTVDLRIKDWAKTTPPVPTAKGIAAVLEAIVETVKDTGPDGVPGGILYAGLMAMGCSYSMFEALMGALVREGKLVKRGQLYFVKGEQL